MSNYVAYGPDANCTLTLCPVSDSVYQYRPSLAANAVFLALYGIAFIIHAVLGFKWRTWAFAIAMLLGCVSEMIGYGGRIMLWKNPFSFIGFLIQISKFNFKAEVGKKNMRVRGVFKLW